MGEGKILAYEEQCELLTKVAKEALSHWGIEEKDADIKLLKYRENAVFRVRVSGGQKFALRVHRRDYHSDAALESELLWMTALGKTELSVPNVITTQNGELFAHVMTDAFPTAHQCDLLSWVEGRQIAQVEEMHLLDIASLKDVYHTVGKLAAMIHTHSLEWDKPKGFYRQSWDVKGCLGENAIWGCWKDLEVLTEAQRTVFSKAAKLAKKKLSHYGKTTENYGLIHSDFAPENLLKNGSDVHIIDFDDSGFGWFMWEIVTALFFHLGEDCYDASYQALLEGYREIREISAQDLEILPTLFLVRGLVYVGWMHTRSETETAEKLTDTVIQMTLKQAQTLLQVG